MQFTINLAAGDFPVLSHLEGWNGFRFPDLFLCFDLISKARMVSVFLFFFSALISFERLDFDEISSPMSFGIFPFGPSSFCVGWLP